MNHYLFLSIVKEFNDLMRAAIEGPNCVDFAICNGACCSIKIDVPSVLAKEYIKRGYARKEDFIRSDTFSYHLRFDEQTGKCFMFDIKINGCKVHDSGIKPPQCWIYPTGFSKPENVEINCKKVNGWKIIDYKKTNMAKDLLQKYVFLCISEARSELKKINRRLGKFRSKNSIALVDKLKGSIKKCAPSRLGGFKDGWNRFISLPAEGLSLQMKNFCQEHNKTCVFLPDDFLKCQSICEEVAINLIEFLQHVLYDFVKRNGLDTDGEYPLYKLFNYSKANHSLL